MFVMGKRINFTRDQENEIINFYLKPESIEEVSRVFKLSASTIKRILRENTIPRHSADIRKSIIITKTKNNNINKYGVEWYTQTLDFVNKTKETCLNKYGVDNVSQLQEVKDKKLEKSIERYGCKNPSQSRVVRDKVKQTCLNQYGVDCNLKLEKVKSDIKSTNMKKYGVEYFTQSKMFKMKMLENKSKSMHKQYVTKKRNNSFNKSKPEEDFFSYLLSKFSCDDVYRQYKDSRYPFACDFYIKSKDLFIELNLHWSHGNHPFDQNNKEDVKLLECWKDKHTKYYDNAVYVWSYLDLKKQMCARKNKLNYVSCYTLDDAISYINTI